MIDTEDSYPAEEAGSRPSGTLTYAASGVDYEALDPFKRMAQAAALRTVPALAGEFCTEISWSRGESAYLMQVGNRLVMGVVEEGLGTKNLVADAMRSITGRTHYDTIAQDTIAMMVNDLCTLGVQPKVITMHVAAGNSEWFEDAERNADLTRGWADACIQVGATWGCGESPSLKGVVVPGATVLSGSAIGFAHLTHILSPQKILDGDVIVLLESNGIHANGLSLARTIASQLPDGYRTSCNDGRMFGEALLDPTHLYSPIVHEAQEIPAAGGVHYAVNITGHGWRKLMRASEPFEYTIDRIPNVQPVFRFLQTHSHQTDAEMYATYNMGAGFALYMSESHAQYTIAAAAKYNIGAFVAGRIRKSDKSRVVIKPLDIVYEADSLNVR